ncbi:AbiV family abortive infection protein [Niallia sp. BSM11]|uniref:AbiV family abortive infection protein n=1 Tax=Niallia sp. BSM11 TaxID=3391576 RepID=UPI003984D8EE
MSIEQIDQGRKIILKTVEELLEDAILLFKNERFARAYTISHLAFEEIAKILMLAQAAEKINQEPDYNWDRVLEELRNHRPKLLQSINFNPEHERAFEKLTGFKFNQVNRITTSMNRMKNESLYTSIKNGVFNSPSQVISKEKANIMYEIAKLTYDFIKSYEKNVKDNYAYNISDEEFFEFLQHMEYLDVYELLDEHN